MQSRKNSLWLALAAAFAFNATPSPAQPPAQPTFSEDIAPILHEHCVECHRQGEIGPFPLVAYTDVSRRGRRIAEAVSSRVMPPWQPIPGYGDFVGERTLTAAEIGLIRAWVDGGMPLGEPARMPAVPDFPEDWPLGEPDLVLEMTAAFELPADGHDIYRNFVLPTGLDEDKWVRAVALRPRARAAAHHALFAYVEQGAFASRDGTDGQPGFGGSMAVGFVPGLQNSGSLGGWAVGGRAMVFPEDSAVSLPAGSDFLLQMHFHPTGSPERERAQVGLYFADEPPRKAMASLELPALFGFGAGIDIPAGEARYEISDSFTLPAEVVVHSVWGHAHYLGKEMKVDATLPAGAVVPLLFIQSWDFNWQEIYRYADPPRLPKGTRIDAVITYDNSRDNPRNPHDPPRPVHWGLESMDEMGTVGFLLEITQPDEEALLRQMLTERTQTAIRRAAEDGTLQRYLDQQRLLNPR